MQNCNKLGQRLEEIWFKVADLYFHCVTSRIDGFQEPTSQNQWVPRNPYWRGPCLMTISLNDNKEYEKLQKASVTKIFGKIEKLANWNV